METNKIKSFAKEARLLLLDGVLQRLKYWGFSANGHNDQDLQSTQGGYIFREQIYTNTTVPSKWKALKERLKSEETVNDIIEEAAYTWFNRLMAIKILEANGYLEPTLLFAEGVRTPLIVQNAKKGQHNLKSKGDQDLLIEYLQEDKEEQAFGLLITDLCNRNKLLHDIFGRIDDYTEILLPQNILQKDGLLDLINSDDVIAVEDYKEVELIGWLYQFYISDKKDEVFAGFKKNKKARAEDIPAATQIFTPKWIVKYMVENTVGKIYLDYEPTSTLKEDMKYLVQNESDQNSDAIISDITELTLIDPASGSGHILVTGFELLFKMYREEGYTAKQAVDNILANNLFGLDIDDRAMQLARFAVLLKAAQFDADVLNRGIIPHVYSFPEEKHFTSEEVQVFLGHEGQQFTAELKEALQLLNQGKNIGSALKVELNDEAQSYIKKQYTSWVQKYQNAGLDIQQESVWNRISPFLDVLLVLTKKYTAVVANPPYMGQANMNGKLKSYILDNYPLSKSDLYTVLLERISEIVSNNGRYALITPPSWLFTISYAKLRELLLENSTVDSLLNLGRGIFGADFGSASYVFIKKSPDKKRLSLFRSLFRGKSYVDSISQKEEWFLDKSFNTYFVSQKKFDKVPNNAFAYWIPERAFESFENLKTLSDYADAKQGMATSDNNRFRRNWYEINISKSSIKSKDNAKWFPYNSGGEFRKWYGNQYYVINWENSGSEIKNFEKSVIRNEQYYFKESISWSKVTIGGLAFRAFPKGFAFDVAGCSVFSDSSNDLLYLQGILNSNLRDPFVYAISQSVNYEVGIINNFPIKFPEDNSTKEYIISLVKDCIEIAKKDWDKNELSWNFKSLSILDSSSISEGFKTFEESVQNNLIKIYENELEINQRLLNEYNLENDISADIALKEVTIYQDIVSINNEITVQKTDYLSTIQINKAEVVSQFISYAIGVFLGRYRLDKPGLNITHPNPSDEELENYRFNGHDITIDDDGILPLMGEDCAFPDDILVRTKEFIQAIWGEDSLTENINFIHDALGMDLHKWLVEKFWNYHTSMYKKKPIYWLFSSNVNKPQNAAFKVLVYMHRMDKYTVQKIQRNYLYPHQEHIKREIENLTENESDLSKSEMKRLEQLRNWELECRDYNEVLKALANQQIEFDLDDGVSVNYAKFAGAVAKI